MWTCILKMGDGERRVCRSIILKKKRERERRYGILSREDCNLGKEGTKGEDGYTKTHRPQDYDFL